MGITRKLSIRWKVASAASLILALTIGTLIVHFVTDQQQILLQELEKRLQQNAETISWLLAPMLNEPPASSDPSKIEEIIRNTAKDEDLESIRVEDTLGNRLAGHNDLASNQKLQPKPVAESPIYDTVKDKVYKVTSIATKDRNNIGVLRMSYSLESYNQNVQRSLSTGLLFGLLTFVAGSLAAFYIGHRIARPLARMTVTFKRVAQGDLNQSAFDANSSDEIGLLAEALNGLLNQMKELNRHAQAIAAGDLSRQISARGDLADTFREMVDSLIEITSKLEELSVNMEKQTSAILTTAKEQEAGAAEQAATVSEVTSTMEELAATARQISNSAESVTQSAEETAQAVKDGRDSLFSFVQSMNSIETGNKTINDNIISLNRHVQQIGGIIELINDIADRTDLLALNAALEGTKAGEAGKGFLLVAAEMRRLAENVISSTSEIKKLISEVTEATNATVMATESGLKATREGAERAGQAERAFGRIVDSIEETRKASKQISLATQQQNTGTDQIVSAMGEVSDVAQQGLEGIRQTTQAVSDLSAITSQLKILLSKYKKL